GMRLQLLINSKTPNHNPIYCANAQLSKFTQELCPGTDRYTDSHTLIPNCPLMGHLWGELGRAAGGAVEALALGAQRAGRAGPQHRLVLRLLGPSQPGNNRGVRPPRLEFHLLFENKKGNALCAGRRCSRAGRDR
ncbi:hypothetical protein HGM15179_013929, partial [Zosterops borbonicus]